MNAGADRSESQLNGMLNFTVANLDQVEATQLHLGRQLGQLRRAY